MANILSAAQIIQKFLDFYKSAQPSLNTSPGSVARDLFVDGPSIRLSELYAELTRISDLQSISKSVGSDLENLASNYSAPRLQSGKSSGPAILTFNSLLSDIVIPGGSMVYGRNGLAYRIINGIVISAGNETQYRAVAQNFRTDLDYVGITDIYAAQVIVECTSTGNGGNISKYALSSVSIPGINNVTNAVPFTGGTSSENDAAYKTRLLSVFSGSNTGTAVGYKNIVSSNPFVIDSLVIRPGDPLMTRDGSVQQTDDSGNLVLDSNGDPIIISEGTGGKVDIIAYGRRVIENLDSFIYNDKSGKNDPTQEINDFTIGQIAGDENKTIMKRRYENLRDGVLPNQPVQNIVEVIGSRSGTFSQEIIDQYGNSIGNFNLKKDTGTYAGSVWGFDKLHWIKNYVSYNQDVTKNTFNGQDSLSFSDATKITALTRTIQVTNENSTVDPSDKSYLTLNHTPIRSINKVLNATTGERYVVSNRNPGGNIGDLNTSGQIIISGKNLPSVSDVLQVDYEWDYSHDVFADLDCFQLKDNPRTAIDVIDWGYGNAIRRESELVATGYTVVTVHNVSAVISVNKVTTDLTKIVEQSTTTGEGLIIRYLSAQVSNIVSVTRSTDGAELYNTYRDDGTFDGNKIVLPTDTSAEVGDSVTVVFNATDLYTIGTSTGTFKDNTIYLPAGASSLISVGNSVEVNYVANISDLLTSTNISSLPAVKYGNGFITSATPTAYGTQPVTNVYLGIYPTKNLRKTPTKLGINVSGITTNGIIAIRGTTSKLIKDFVFTSTNAGLQLDLSLAIKQYLGQELSTDLSTSISVSKLISVEKVETYTAQSPVVTSVLKTYNITGYALLSNLLDLDNSIANSALNQTSVILPTTAENSLEEILVGDRLRISFYIITDSDTENVSFSSNGTLYSDKSFVYLDSVSVSSGFKTNAVISGAISISALSQPPITSRYKVAYNYLAPKAGERISIRYNSNALMQDLTLALEDKRPITADVIIKSASSILVDVYVSIIITKEYQSSATLVKQNVGDRIAAFINETSLGATINPSDIINAAYQVAGLDAISIVRFNKSTESGNALAVTALKNEYIQANIVNVA